MSPKVSRRALLASCAALPALAAVAEADEPAARGPLGLVIHSVPVRLAAEKERMADPVRFLDFARSLGAAGIQTNLGARDDAWADALREKARAASMYVEGIVSPPRDRADLPRFEAEVRTAKRAGADVVRTVCRGGRRYETFGSPAAFRAFADLALASLTLAAPVAAREGVKLAVENHKDWRSDELIGLLNRVGSDHVGVCLDTGNSLALLEDPAETVAALAPFAFTTHIKDMAVTESADGFLLAEVPLGAGALDLPRLVRTIREARPGVRLVLEMITRDPLHVPCLTDRYWAPFPDLPGVTLARTLRYVRDHPPREPIPRVGALDPAARLRLEDENLRRCFDGARKALG